MSACRFGFEIVAPPAQRKRDKDAPVVVSFKEAKGGASLAPKSAHWLIHAFLRFSGASYLVQVPQDRRDTTCREKSV